MSNHTLSLFRSCCAALFCLGALLGAASGQQPQTPQQPDDVVKISTDLIQTDVTVLDKQGRFVDNLRREQFELLVDGKPQPIIFFEQIKAGSSSEETQLAASRNKTISQEPGVARPMDRGRTIFFFIDDMHMVPGSLIRVRKTLLQFIEREMGQNDQVAITSANGQVGFLQQLTDNKAVLRAAVERLKSSAQVMRDAEYPPMTEALALAIEVYNDADVLKYFVEPLISKGMSQSPAENIVRVRAKRVLQESYQLTRLALTTLESLTRSSAPISGRKLIFFISDGFMLNQNEADIAARIRNITNASAKNGVVIYSLDARGLAGSGFGEADNNRSVAADPRGEMMGVISRYATRDVSATQEPLRMIAANTGGRAFLNSNSLNAGFSKAIRETSVYYLLAWQPEKQTPSKDKFRQVEVKVTGRPDLNVQLRRGYYDVATQTVAVSEKPKDVRTLVKTAADDLRDAIGSPYPTNALPTQLGLVYVNTPDKGLVMTASIQIARQFMTFKHAEDKQTTVIDLSGVVLNDQGKVVTGFKDRLDLAVYFPQYVGPPRRDLVYNYQSPLAPGLYQVRVAARDSQSGRTGSAMQWIEIPDLSTRRLSLSSLLVGETTKDAETMKSNSAELAQAMLSVDRRFARTSKLRFLTYVYNAARGANGASPPDVSIQVQILRDDQPVTTALRKIEPSAADPTRLPYAAEIPLQEFLPGHYVLQITAIDRIAKSSVTQFANFEIE